MTGHVKDGGAWKQFSDLFVKDAGVWKTVKTGYIKDAGVWKEFFSGLLASASLNRTSLTGAGISGTVETVNDVTCTPVGGSGYAYTWQRVSGDTEILINFPSSATTKFRINIDGTYSSIFRCRVVAGGVTVYSNNVSVDLERGPI